MSDLQGVKDNRTFETRGLTVEQQRRAEALRIARDVVVTTAPPNHAAMWSGGDIVDVVDLLAVAQFILTGEDPWPTTQHESDIVDRDALGVE